MKNDWRKSLPEEIRRKLKKKSQPSSSWTNPMLVTLTRKRFSDENWMFERKLDGERYHEINPSSTSSVVKSS